MLFPEDVARKYVFGIKLEDEICTVSISTKNDWIKYKKYNSYISSELESVMDYFGYEKSIHDWEFINESENRNINDIIDSFNKSPILEYNEDFNDFALSYVYCIGKEEYSEEGETTVYVTPNLYWLNKKCQSDEETDSYICKYLGALGFEEVGDTTFISEDEFNDYGMSTLKENLDKYKYLKIDKSFDEFINN